MLFKRFFDGETVIQATYIAYQMLPAEKLALMAFIEGLGLGIGMTSVGVIIFFSGLGVYLSNSNNQALAQGESIPRATADLILTGKFEAR